jgi:glycosyltransferase involved in cell wall biosynthesis
MELNSQTKKYIIVDFGASLRHTHHIQSIIAFSQLLENNNIEPEIWVPMGSTAELDLGLTKFNLLPGTHPCEFKITEFKTWLPGILGKLHHLGLKYRLDYLIKFVILITSTHFCKKVQIKSRNSQLSLIFTTLCPFAIRSILTLESKKVHVKIFCRLTNTSETRGRLSEIYPVDIITKSTFNYLKLRLGFETSNFRNNFNTLSHKAYISKFPSQNNSYLKKFINEHPTISFLGYPTRDKGHGHIITIIEKVYQQRPNINWQVHLYDNDPIETKLKEMNLPIEFIRGKFSGNTITKMIQKTDIMCLPYDVNAFRYKASAMFYKSSDFKIPIITFLGTGFAEDVLNFNCGFAGKDLESIINEIINLNSNQINAWKKGCEIYNSFRNNSNLIFLDIKN